MQTPDLPLGRIAKAAAWLKAFAAMPEAIAAMLKAQAAEFDPRPVCLTCGKGRVAYTLSRPRSLDRGVFRTRYGRCEACLCWWEVTPPDGAAMRLIELVGHADQDTPPKKTGEGPADLGHIREPQEH